MCDLVILFLEEFLINALRDNHSRCSSWEQCSYCTDASCIYLARQHERLPRYLQFNESSLVHFYLCYSVIFLNRIVIEQKIEFKIDPLILEMSFKIHISIIRSSNLDELRDSSFALTIAFLVVSITL